MTIGAPFGDLSHIRDEYGKVVAGSKYKMYAGLNATIESSDYREKHSAGIIDADIRAEALAAAMAGKDDDQLKQSLKALSDEFRLTAPKPESVYNIMNKIYISVRKRVKVIDRIEKECFGEGFDYYRTILDLDFIDDIMNSTLDYYQKLMNCVDDNRMSKPVELAIRFIETNYDKEISFSEIAKLVHLNSVYFSQLFKRETGHNFTQYLIQHRIEAAKELLHDGNNRISEISFKVGYDDPNYFSRIFKKVTGLSPYEYRSKCGGADDKTPN
jgi:YesN/AraC family two-component response regulator